MLHLLMRHPPQVGLQFKIDPLVFPRGMILSQDSRGREGCTVGCVMAVHTSGVTPQTGHAVKVCLADLALGWAEDRTAKHCQVDAQCALKIA